MPSAITLNVIMQSVIMLSVIMPSVIMPSTGTFPGEEGGIQSSY